MNANRDVPFLARWPALGCVSLMCGKPFGLWLSLALVVVVFTYELGRWLVCATAQCRAHIWVTPWGGMCITMEEPLEDVFTAYGKGILYLAGPAACLCLVILVRFLRIFLPVALLGPTAFWGCVELLCLLTNLLNLCALLPFLDGGRVVGLIVSCRARWVGVLFGICSTIQGLCLIVPIFPLFVVLLLALVSAFHVVPPAVRTEDYPLAPSERVILAVVWVALIWGSFYVYDPVLASVAETVVGAPWRAWYAQHLSAF